jgi:hypothetical protein
LVTKLLMLVPALSSDVVGAAMLEIVATTWIRIMPSFAQRAMAYLLGREETRHPAGLGCRDG